MIDDPVVADIIAERLEIDEDLFFISNYSDGSCIGIATRVLANIPINSTRTVIYYRWFIEICGGRKAYYNDGGGATAERLFSHLMEHYPDHLEWLLFHPEWL